MPCIIVWSRYFGDREEYDSLAKKRKNSPKDHTYFYILTRFYFVVIPLLIIWLIVNIP